MTDPASRKASLRQRLMALLDRDAAADPVVPTAEAQTLVQELQARLVAVGAQYAAEARVVDDRLRHLTQLYDTLSKVGQAIIRLRERQTLFEEACRIAVADGTFTMAWIGWLDQRTGAVEPLAWAGDQTGYVQRASITVRDELHGRGPTGTAVREDRFIVVNSVRDDPSMAPWREAALLSGYHAVAALPLHLAGQPVGAMSFYSEEQGFFTPERVGLLARIGQSLSFALDKMQADEVRRQGEQRYRNLFEAMAEGCALHEVICNERGQPCDYRFLDVNPAYERLTGLKRENLIGHTQSEVLPNDDPKFAQLFGQVALTGQPIQLEKHSQISHKDFQGVVYSPGPRLFAGLFTDVTDRKQAEQTLRSSEEKYRQLFATETDALLLFDADTYEMLDVNDSALRLYGYTREEFMALTCWDMTAEPEETRKANDRLMAHGADHVPLRYHSKKDGTVFPMEFSARGFKLGDRLVFGVAVRDITERLRTEHEADDYRKRLQALAMELSLAEERERKDLAAALHDDLIQILALIRIRLALFEQLGQGAQQGEGLAEVRRLVDLANASARSIMLHLSHPILYERGLVPAVEWLAEDMRQLHRLAVSVQTSPDIDPLDLRSRVVLFRCLRELLVNVAKHAGIDRAALELVRTADQVRAIVTDLGAGFDPQDAQARLDGSGFGLFGIKERLATLGGQMIVHSAPGQGTTIILEVPATEPRPEAPPAPDPS